MSRGAAAGLAAVKRGYTDGTRRLASRWIAGLARTRVTPNALTGAGISLCAASAVLVWFGDHNQWLIYWSAAVLFVTGSVLDILDGALARHGGKATPFGAFVDSISDRVSEGFVLTAIALVFTREGREVAVGLTLAAMAGSFLVSYARAKAELLGLKGDVGLGSRAERPGMGCSGRSTSSRRRRGSPCCSASSACAPSCAGARRSILLALLC